ncbi:FkbM family methyltransferase [Knoellia sinensis]|uniref:FkbM family methyltransferase n=1 Tax=Knoellia sinensis TaxID=136100 RepID=UPI00147019C2|nr:FkbM family methyltransferase [Knoellia sinensis]
MDWIVDAGANTGLASVYFAERFPDARIIAIEPDDGNFEILERNTQRYGQRIIRVRAALWSTTGVVDLVDPGSGAWAMRVRSAAEDQAIDGKVVSAITLSDLIREFDIDRISILKVDIEGGESEVFRNPSAWIERVDSIVIELHDRFVPDCSAIFHRATTAFSLRAVKGEDTFVAR